MAGSPDLKVYRDGEYRASCKYAEEAAMICAGSGEGTEIRFQHNPKLVLWREGAETQPAGESFDHVTEIVTARLEAYQQSAAEARTLEAIRARRRPLDLRTLIGKLPPY